MDKLAELRDIFFLFLAEKPKNELTTSYMRFELHGVFQVSSTKYQQLSVQ
jgi:hypothetical protein